MTAEMLVYFLGTDERKNTQLYPIRQLVTVGYIDNVLHNHVAHFKDESERQEFLSEYMRIKNTIASFDRSNQRNFEKRLMDEWLPLCAAFISRWGKESVPKDLRHSIRDVQQGLCISPLMEFPEYHLYKFVKKEGVAQAWSGFSSRNEGKIGEDISTQ